MQPHGITQYFTLLKKFFHSLLNTQCELYYKCMTVKKGFDINLKFTHEHMLLACRNIEPYLYNFCQSAEA